MVHIFFKIIAEALKMVGHNYMFDDNVGKYGSELGDFMWFARIG